MTIAPCLYREKPYRRRKIKSNWNDSRRPGPVPLPPLTVPLSIPRERYYALRAEALRRGLSMPKLLRERLDPWLNALPAGAGPDQADDEETD
jgi:hypothetical protein